MICMLQKHMLIEAVAEYHKRTWMIVLLYSMGKTFPTIIHYSHTYAHSQTTKQR